MKTTFFSTIIFVVFFLFLAKTTISFKPFKIQFSELLTATGYVLIILGISCIKIETKQNAIKETITKVNEIIDETIQEIKEK